MHGMELMERGKTCSWARLSSACDTVQEGETALAKGVGWGLVTGKGQTRQGMQILPKAGANLQSLAATSEWPSLLSPYKWICMLTSQRLPGELDSRVCRFRKEVCEGSFSQQRRSIVDYFGLAHTDLQELRCPCARNRACPLGIGPHCS